MLLLAAGPDLQRASGSALLQGEGGEEKEHRQGEVWPLGPHLSTLWIESGTFEFGSEWRSSGPGGTFSLHPSTQALQRGVGEQQALERELPTFSRPFSEARLRGGQITANFPFPLLAVGEGTLSRGCPSSCQLEDGRTP